MWGGHLLIKNSELIQHNIVIYILSLCIHTICHKHNNNKYDNNNNNSNDNSNGNGNGKYSYIEGLVQLELITIIIILCNKFVIVFKMPEKTTTIN